MNSFIGITNEEMVKNPENELYGIGPKILFRNYQSKGLLKGKTFDELKEKLKTEYLIYRNNDSWKTVTKETNPIQFWSEHCLSGPLTNLAHLTKLVLEMNASNASVERSFKIHIAILVD